MRREHTGFTLIEVIVVIALLAILAAMAVPRYVELARDSADATARAVAAAITSGTALNYGKYVSAGNSGVQVSNGTACGGLPSFLDHGLDAGLTVAGTSVAGCSGGGTLSSSCSVEHARGTAGGFAAIAVCTN